MTTIASSGVSTKLDSLAAGKEAAQIAYHKLGRREPDVVFTFISTIFEQTEAINGICSVMKDAPLIGCSSAGSIVSDGPLRGAVSVCAIYSDSISFSFGIGKQLGKNSRLAGHRAATEALSAAIKDKTTKAFVIFSDSLSGNSADVLRGAQEVLGTGFPIIGATAADELCFQKTYQYLNNNIYSDSVVGVLLSGDINIGMGKGLGWQPIGKPHKVTKARSNIIREIDKKAAIGIYEEYFDRSFEELKGMGIGKLSVNYPLGVKIKGKNEYLIRSSMRVEDNGSLVLSAEIPEGEDVSLMIGDRNLALKAARSACTEATRGMQGRNIRFIIVFDDIARYNLLRKDSQKETDIIKEVFGKGAPLTGFYCYGEYGSLDTYEHRGWSDFQNQAFSIAVFSE